jgi:regulator of protease activity HflC (stomatin/prohibitin superfamily)
MKHKSTRKIGYSVVGDALSAITSNPYFIAASLAFQGFSMIEQMNAGDDAAAAAAKAADLQRRQNEAEAAKQRIQQEREARIRRANVTTTAANVGATGSSSVETSIGSIGTTAISNISNINEKLGFATAIGQAQTDQYQAQADASFWKTMGGMPNMLSSAGSMFKSPSASKFTNTTNSNVGAYDFAPYPKFG